MKIVIKNSIKKMPLKLALISLAILMAVAVPLKLSETRVYADEYDDKIALLKADIANYESKAAELAAKSDTLEVALAELQNQLSALQAKLAVTQAEYDQLTLKIAETETKIKNSKDTLGKTIANMYVDGKITPLEMLASSKNIGDYLDKQEYQTSIRNELTSTIEEIKTLKETLSDQKAKVEIVLLDQKQQNEVLASKKAEQQRLLDETKGNEAAYQSMISSNNDAIKTIRAEQAAYFASLANQSSIVLLEGDANKGGYPSYYANSPQDSLVDEWGMYNRECVSYTAWKVYQTYGYMPYWGGIGNAWQWAYSGYYKANGAQAFYNSGYWHEANSTTYSIPSGTTPKVGSVAVMNGEYGHVAWVEAVSGDKITISQYNWYLPNNGGWGQYSEMVVDASLFGRYLYFGEW